MALSQNTTEQRQISSDQSMKELQIKLPQTIQECKPEHLYKWLMMADVIKNEKDDIIKLIEFQCQLLSVFSGMPMSKIKKADLDSIAIASRHILSVISSYQYQEPKELIEIQGQKYRFEKKFSHISTGQIIDLKLIEDVSLDPYSPLAIMYVEDGMEYCQEDERGRVLNPNKNRYDIFKEHFPGDQFLNFFNFFLLSSEKQRLAILGIQTARMMMQRMILEQELRIQNGISGQESYIDYPKRWDAVWKELQDSHM